MEFATQNSMERAFVAGAAENLNQRKSKLTEPQVMTIFSLRPNNSDNRIVCSSTELAVYYRVSSDTIKNIWNGRTWSVETGMMYHPYKPRPRDFSKSKAESTIDDQLFKWANTRFVHKKLFTNDSIPNLTFQPTQSPSL